jgi:hypothetical protein
MPKILSVKYLHALSERQAPVEVHLVGVDQGIAEIGVSLTNLLFG